MSVPQLPKQPLQKIAISLSGGGYRAASFHLGCLSYLNHLHFGGKPLLEQVKMISTVSGGSITGIVYTLLKKQGKSFEEISSFILEKLHKLDLLSEGIEKLSPGGKWSNQHKHRNLVNAFAELYDREFTNGKTFKELHELKSHLEAVVFNSTEFSNGINFRFRNRGTGYFGNYYIQIPQSVASEVKLSDAMAASSCFPGGFEPIIWPDDFLYDGARELFDYKSKKPSVGLMDGGIYDNQGVDSILGYNKNSREPYFDLIIISDVASPYMESYQPTIRPDRQRAASPSLLSIYKKIQNANKKISSYMLLLFLILLFLPLIVGGGYLNNFITGLSLGLAGAIVLLWVGKKLAVKYLLRKGNDLLQPLIDLIPPFFRKPLSLMQIERITIDQLRPLLLDRVYSLKTLLMDVFLKVVRRLNYYKLYDNRVYHYRRISTLIRELTEDDYNERLQRKTVDQPNSNAYLKNTILNGSYESVVGPNIKKLVEEVAGFGTTLWITPQNELDDVLNKLVVAGKITMCYNLLKYLEQVIFEEGNGFNELPRNIREDLTTTYQRCKNDWLLYKEEPFKKSIA
jgi:predicted acylesterase/phospholipase RssA